MALAQALHHGQFKCHGVRTAPAGDQAQRVSDGTRSQVGRDDYTHLADQPGSQERAVEPATRVDSHGGDVVPLGELAQRGGQVHPVVTDNDVGDVVEAEPVQMAGGSRR